ncbi:DUF7507 domain-containing protein, partial [Algoriphagus limi]|nr:hypothetical protein [Algoriphagus limi]
MEGSSKYQFNPTTPSGDFFSWVKNRFTVQLSGFSWLFIFFLFIQTNAFAQTASDPVTVLMPKGGFEIDGNLLPSNNFSPFKKGGDWINSLKTASDSVVFYDSLGTIVPIERITTFRSIDLFGNGSGDNILSGKANEDPNNWSWSIGNATGKGDINNAYLHIGQDDQGNQWLIVGADRRETNGASYLDFEFFQATTELTFPDGGGNVVSTGPDGGRTQGDLQISITYSNGGSNPIIKAFRWGESSPGAGDWDYYEDTQVDYHAFTNQVDGVENPFGAFGAFEYSSYQFVEAAINVQSFLDGEGIPCQDLTIGSVLVKTKNSGSLSAELTDLIFPIEASLVFGDAAISYEGQDFCGDYAYVTQTGVQGGTYSYKAVGHLGDLVWAPTPAFPAGTIDLNASAPGEYEITYSFTTGGCDKKTKPLTIIIPKNGIEPVVLNSEFCSGSGIQAYDVTSAGNDYTLLYYDTETSNTPLGSIPSVDTDASAPGTYSVWVSQIKDGECESPRVEVSITVQTCSIALVKTGTIDMTVVAPNDRVDEGDVINYSFIVTNSGTSPINDVSITDLKVTVSGEPIAILAPGGVDNSTFTASYTLTQADIDAGTFTNTAEVSGTTLGTPVSATDDDVQTLFQNKALTLDKQVVSGDPYTSVGDQVVYDYVITNSGNVTLAGPFSVTDDRIPNIADVNGPLAPGASVTATGTYTITQADLDAGFVTNIASASGNGVTSNEDTETVNATQSPALTLDKQVVSGDPYASVGDQVVYDYVITNSGNVTLAGPFSVTDDRIPNIADVNGPLAPGASVTATGTYIITQADLDAGSVTNIASASGNSVSSNEDTETVNATQSPALTLDKQVVSGDPYASVGDQVVYDYVITNSGNVTLAGPFSVTDDRIPNIADVNGPLAPGASVTATGTYIITQSDLDAGSVTNIASASGNSVTSNEDTETVNAYQLPSIELIKDGDFNDENGNNIADVGETISYNFTVNNTGNVTLTNITISDPLVNVIGGPISSLAPGVSNNSTFTAQYVLTQQDIDFGSFTNIATVSGTAPNQAIVIDEDEHSEFFVPTPDIEINKTAAPNLVNAAGKEVTYTLTVTNTGNVTLTNVTITDPLTGFNENVGTLVPDAVVVRQTVYNVTQADIDNGSILNVATATGTNGQAQVSD